MAALSLRRLRDVQEANIYPCVLLKQLKTFKIVFLTKKRIIENLQFF
jgi:hypothetical protein